METQWTALLKVFAHKYEYGESKNRRVLVHCDCEPFSCVTVNQCLHEFMQHVRQQNDHSNCAYNWLYPGNFFFSASHFYFIFRFRSRVICSHLMRRLGLNILPHNLKKKNRYTSVDVLCVRNAIDLCVCARMDWNEWMRLVEWVCMCLREW